MENYETYSWETESQKTQRFWMVVGNGNSPKVRHTTKQFAKDEAERLARKNPGIEFFVLEAVEVFQQPSGMRHEIL